MRRLLAMVLAVRLAGADHDDETRVDLIDGGYKGWHQGWTGRSDRVMGGRSTIDVRRTVLGDEEEYDDEYLRSAARTVLAASGTLRTANGGFAGISRWLVGGAWSGKSLNLAGVSGVRVTFEAMPESELPLVWEIRFTGSCFWSSCIDFGAAFAVMPSADEDAVGSATIPFSAFRARRRGRPVQASFDPSQIQSMGFLLLYQEGPFDVRFRSIEAVFEVESTLADPPPPTATSPGAVYRTANAALARGAALFNKGYGPHASAALAATCRSLADALDAVPIPADDDGDDPRDDRRDDAAQLTLLEYARIAVRRAAGDAERAGASDPKRDGMTYMVLRRGLQMAQESADAAITSDDFENGPEGWPAGPAPAPALPDEPDEPPQPPPPDDDDQEGADGPRYYTKCKSCIMTLFIFGLALSAAIMLTLACCVCACGKERGKVTPFKPDA